MAGRSLASSAFDITWAIENGKIDESLSIISDLVKAGKKHYEIIGLLCWHVKRLLTAKMLANDADRPWHPLETRAVSRLGVRPCLRVGRPTKLLYPPVQSPSLRLAHAKDRVVEGARGRHHFGNDVSRLESASAVLPQLLLRDLQRQLMACLPRVSIEIYGRCPAPGPPVSHEDSTRISREGCSSGRSDRSPLPPPRSCW